MVTRGLGETKERFEKQQRRITRGIRRIMRAIDVKSHRLARERGVTRAQLLSLRSIGRETTTNATELAAQFHLSPSTVVGILDRLESKGYIERARDEADRRIVNVVITESGREFLEGVMDPVAETLEAAINGHTLDDIRRIADGTEELADLLNASDGPDAGQKG